MKFQKAKELAAQKWSFAFRLKEKYKKNQLMLHFIISAQIATLEMRDFPPSNPLTVFPLWKELSANGMKQPPSSGIAIKICAADAVWSLVIAPNGEKKRGSN